MKKKPLVSVIMPCLNEEEAVGGCIDQIKAVFTKYKINGEIIVCDNGSTDKSRQIIKQKKAVLVIEPDKGYGLAYLKGFAAAKGKYLIMADSDGTYDFNEIPNFLKLLITGGYDFVSGSRYKNTSPIRILPPLNNYLGNPMLTGILNYLFDTHYTDVYSGFRGFTKTAYKLIKPVSPGMEFNLELAINAKLANLRTTEIPISLHKRKGSSKLNVFRDGWKSLRMMILYSPNKIFIYPGTFVFALGLLVHFATLTKLIAYLNQNPVSSAGIYAIIFSITGFQIINFGLLVKTYSWTRRFDPDNQMVESFYKLFRLETGLAIGSLLLLCGLLGLILEIIFWQRSNLIQMSSPEWVAFLATITIIGLNTIFTTLFISSMSLKKGNL